MAEAEPLEGRVAHLLQQVPLQPTRRHDNCTRRAAVAVLLRLSRYPEQPLRSLEDAVAWCASAKPFVEIFFIKRATNPKDRWSGHIALPGGHQEGDETDEQACVRETREEVGIDLSRDFLFLGKMDERRMKKRKGTLCVACLVYLHLVKEPPQLTLQKSEVQSAFWVPEQVFQEYVLRNAGPREFAVATNKYWKWMKYPIVKELVTIVGIDIAYFPCVFLPAPDMDPEVFQQQEQADDDHGYVLWGFTFGVISELLFRMGIGHLRERGAARVRFRGAVATVLATTLFAVLRSAKSLKGFRILAAILAVIIACVAALLVLQR